MCKHLCGILALIALLTACQNETPADRPSSSSPAVTDLQLIGDSVIYFVCQDVTQAADQGPHHDVFLVVGENKLKVGATQVCQHLAKTDYAQQQVPEKALDAVGGEWEGETNIVYAIRTSEDKIVVRQGRMYADKDSDSYDYRAIATLTNEDLSVHPGLNQIDLVGTYAHDGNPKSWVLFIGLSDRYLSGQLFELSQPLPPIDDLASVLTQTTPEVLRGFDVDLLNMTFESHLGQGSITQENNVWAFTFDNIKDAAGQPLKLMKIN